MSSSSDNPLIRFAAFWWAFGVFSLFAVILIVLGIQFISIGLLAALIHAPASRKRTYPIETQIEPGSANPDIIERRTPDTRS